MYSIESCIGTMEQDKNPGFSRRQILKGLGAAAVSVGTFFLEGIASSQNKYEEYHGPLCEGAKPVFSGSIDNRSVLYVKGCRPSSSSGEFTHDYLRIMEIGGKEIRIVEIIDCNENGIIGDHPSDFYSISILNRTSGEISRSVYSRDIVYFTREVQKDIKDFNLYWAEKNDSLSIEVIKDGRERLKEATKISEELRTKIYQELQSRKKT